MLADEADARQREVIRRSLARSASEDMLVARAVVALLDLDGAERVLVGDVARRHVVVPFHEASVAAHAMEDLRIGVKGNLFGLFDVKAELAKQLDESPPLIFCEQARCSVQGLRDFIGGGMLLKNADDLPRFRESQEPVVTRVVVREHCVVSHFVRPRGACSSGVRGWLGRVEWHCKKMSLAVSRER